MNKQSLPINFSELTKLPSLGISPEVIKPTNVGLESQKYVTIKETSPDGSSLFNIIDIENSFKNIKKPIKADYAIMHLTDNIIALRAPLKDKTTTALQVINLGDKKVIFSEEISDQITYWKWLNTKTLGFTTATSAFKITTDGKKEKICDMAPNMKGVQITGMAMDSTLSWVTVSGLSSPDGGKTILGSINLFSIEKNASQFIEGFSPSFGEAPLSDLDNPSVYLAFIHRRHTEEQAFIQIMEIAKKSNNLLKKKEPTTYNSENAADFPISLHIAEKYGFIFMVTKYGQLFIYEMTSAALIFKHRISGEIIFAACRNALSSGILCLNKSGQLFSITINEEKVVPFIINQCGHIPGNAELGFKIAARNKLPGVDSLFVDRFNQLLQSSDYTGAAKIAKGSPGTLIRNAETIAKLKSISAQPPPLIQYFQVMLEGNGKLNSIESVEIAKPMLNSGKMADLQKLIKNGQIEFSTELGDLVKKYDPQLAMSIFYKSNSNDNVIQSMIDAGQLDQVVPFCKKTGYNPNYLNILKNAVLSNPEGAVGFAKMLCNRDGGKDPMVPISTAFEAFMSNSRLVEATGFLLEVLSPNKPEDASMQTKVLEINIIHAQKVAEAIFQMNQLTYYDHVLIAKVCEKYGMYKRAMENYTDVNDVKRVIVNTHVIKKDEIVEFLNKQDAQTALVCMYELMKTNRQNIPTVIEVSASFSEKIPIKEITKMFESFGSFDGMFAFLQKIISTSEDPEVHFKYIEACVKIGNLIEVRNIITTSKFYDPEKVKDFLKSLKLTDPRPLIFLCDMHKYYEELAEYLYKNGFLQHIEIYIKTKSEAAPTVINAILNLSPDETYIRSLTSKIPNCNIDELVKAYETHNKLHLLTTWLEGRANEGNETAAVHTALAKIYVATNNDAKKFIIENQHYDCKEVGKFCEDRDHTLAFLAYKKAWGKCDDELIALSLKNNMYRLLARYCVERMDSDLWKKVLDDANPTKKQLIEQVIQSALPDTQNPEEVAATVKAFLSAKLHGDLIELLDKIVLHNPLFSKNAKLQTLLIFTAINADNTKVMDYINRLDAYDSKTLAEVCMQPERGLYEEAFTIYVKANDSKSAINVLLNHINDLNRAVLFAEKVNDADVWAKLAEKQLSSANMVAEAISSYLKANNAENFTMVIAAAEREGIYDPLIDYILMAKQTVRESLLDNTLLFCYAKTGKLQELEQIITTSHTADITTVADRCYDNKLWEPARVLYTSVGNNARLASCYVYLKNLPLALDAAKKASTPKTWMEVIYACVKAGEFKYAEIAGQHIVTHPDHLDEVVKVYERYGKPMQCIELLEKCLGMEGEHMGMYTDLGMLYAKHDEKKLMGHLNTYYQKLNITKVLAACKKYLLWKEAVFLYAHYDEYDNAILTMIEHSPSCWTHELFIDYIKKVKTTELHFKAIQFYLTEDPKELDSLLTAIAAQLDIPKTIAELRKLGCLPLVEKFLLGIQSQDLSVVNDALNEIFLENDDYAPMRNTVSTYNNFEQLGLAKKLESHELLEFRRIAALIYRKNKKFGESIDLSIKDLMFKDTIDTVLESKDAALAEKLLRLFAVKGYSECFCATLYTCYELIKADVVVELAWRFNLQEYAMPFYIQMTRDVTDKLENVNKKTDEIKKKEEEKENQNTGPPIEFTEMFLPGLTNPMLMPPPPEMMGGGMGMGGMGMGGMGGMGGFMPNVSPFGQFKMN